LTVAAVNDAGGAASTVTGAVAQAIAAASIHRVVYFKRSPHSE